MLEKLLTPTETAKLLSVSTHSLVKWRKDGRGPRCIKIGQQWRYAQSDIESYIQSCREASGKFDKSSLEK